MKSTTLPNLFVLTCVLFLQTAQVPAHATLFNLSELETATNYSGDNNNPILTYSASSWYENSGFDAARAMHPTVLHANGQWLMAYAGEPHNNHLSTGLATSSDGESWSRYSSNPILAYGDQSWASYRLSPVSMMYEAGEYRMWLYGDNANLNPNRIGQVGLATSPDGLNWSLLDINPVIPSGGGSGLNLREVIKLGDTYYAYYDRKLEDGLYVATSSDGVSFEAGTKIHDTLVLQAATTFSHGNSEFILSIAQNENGDSVYALSADGFDFEIDTKPLSFSNTDAVSIRSLQVENGSIRAWGHKNIGNITWNYGNLVIDHVTTSAPIWSTVIVPEPGTFASLAGLFLLLPFLRVRPESASTQASRRCTSGQWHE